MAIRLGANSGLIWEDEMHKVQPDPRRSFLASPDQPLIGVMTWEEGREVIRYFTDEEEAEAASTSESVKRALSLFGAWSDLDWDQAEAELDRIRHKSRPTPPIEL